MSSANLRLRLFGPPVVTGADGVPVGGGSMEPQRLALLALLALHPRRTVSRAELTNYLWPTRNVEQARHALNQALFAISKALGDDAIFPSAKEVRLGTRVIVDALEFQSALDAGRPEDAMRLYTAPLMDGFELDDAPEFQHWAATQRARFATAARTQRPVAAAAIEVVHEPAADGPELLAIVPPEPELMTNAVLSEQESVASVARPGSQESVNVLPPQSAPREEIQSIAPSEPSPAALEPTAAAAPPPATPELQEDVLVADATPAPVESEPPEKRATRRRRGFPRPSARLVVTVLGLAALGAFGYLARGWTDAVLQARERKRSIAVLPIEYSGRNQADAALAARIVEELGPMLTRAGLLVMPSSALTRGGPPYDLRVIADSLGVAHILQGVMQREGDRVAFRFRLVNPVDGSTRWEDTYRPRLTDVQVLQEYVATTVGAQILGGPRERD